MPNTPPIRSIGSSDSPPGRSRQLATHSQLQGRSIDIHHFPRNALTDKQLQSTVEAFNRILIPTDRPCQSPIHPKIKSMDVDVDRSYFPNQSPIKVEVGSDQGKIQREGSTPVFLQKVYGQKFEKINIDPDGNCMYNAVIAGIKRMNPDHPLADENAYSLRKMVQAAIVSSDEFIESIISMLLAEVWEDVKHLAAAKKEFELPNVPSILWNKFKEFYIRYLSSAANHENLDQLDNEVSGWIISEGWSIYSDGIASGVTFSGGVEAQVLSSLFGTPIRIHKLEKGIIPIVQDVGDCHVPDESILHLLLRGSHYSLLLLRKPIGSEDAVRAIKEDFTDSESEFDYSLGSLLEGVGEAIYKDYQVKNIEDDHNTLYNAVIEGIKLLHPSHELAEIDSVALRSLIEEFNPEVKRRITKCAANLHAAWGYVKNSSCPQNYLPEGYEDKFMEFHHRYHQILRSSMNRSELGRYEEEISEWIRTVGAKSQTWGVIPSGAEEFEAISDLYRTPIRIVLKGAGGIYDMLDVGNCTVPEENMLHLLYEGGKYSLLIHPSLKKMMDKTDRADGFANQKQSKRDDSPKRKKVRFKDGF